MGPFFLYVVCVDFGVCVSRGCVGLFVFFVFLFVTRVEEENKRGQRVLHETGRHEERWETWGEGTRRGSFWGCWWCVCLCCLPPCVCENKKCFCLAFFSRLKYPVMPNHQRPNKRPVSVFSFFFFFSATPESQDGVWCVSADRLTDVDEHFGEY